MKRNEFKQFLKSGTCGALEFFVVNKLRKDVGVRYLN